MTQSQPLPHKLTLTERSALTVTGVSEVVSFDEHAAILRTNLGTLVVQGQNLQLKQLTLEGGDVAVEGEISSLVYEQTRSQGSLFSRLFG